jgi:two-component system, chemotaxis family, protein-glutamate methylesterase/glutaminase
MVMIMVARRDLVVIGGSAGGITALITLLRELPATFAASIVVVLHRPAGGSGQLRSVLSRKCALPVETAGDGDPLRTGCVYLAPPDFHALVRPEHLHLARTAKVNRVRPAVDPLFHSAARYYGPRAVGVVLSGSLDDGSVGLAAIDARGGLCLVQDPKEALFAGMPLAALAAVPTAKAMPVADLGSALVELVGSPVDDAEFDVDPDLIAETDMTHQFLDLSGSDQPGVPVAIACPDCRGGMTRIDGATTVHFRCHVGHTYSPQSLLAAQQDSTEGALWTAISILEERAAVHQSLAERTEDEEQERHLRAAEQARLAADSIRPNIQNSFTLPPAD